MSSNDNFDIDFSIPNVSETPSLEEILAKGNDDFEFGDELVEQDSNLSTNIDLESILTSVSTKSDIQIESSFIVIELNFIKSQLSLSKSDKIDSGNPTALTISKNYINVGTFHGHILVFSFDDKLIAFLKHEKNFASICSMSVNNDETRLICGGSRGSVSLWNLTNFELMRLVDDLHAPFTSILMVQHLSNHNFVILNDTSGSVFFLDIRKKNFDSQCVFSGSRGETLVLRPLSYDEIPNAFIYNGIENLCLLAMATVSKIIVISLRPGVVVHFTFSLKANLDSLPLICWNLSFEYNNEMIPLLTFGRQDQLYIHRMVTDFVEKIDFIPLFQFTTTNYCLQHINWIENDKLFIMDTSETGHLIDVVAQEELERIDLSHVELIYENAHYKSLVNGGYVSRAMAKAGEHACNNSFSLKKCPDKNRIFLLGRKSVFQLTLRNWDEKIDYFLNGNNHSKALQLLYDNYLLYKDRKPDIEINRILSKIDLSLKEFVQYIINSGLIDCKNEITIKETISIYLKYSIYLVDKHRKIFELFEKISENAIFKSLLVECLEQYIFDDEFPNLNPIIVQEIIDYYLHKGWYNLVDSLITHLDICSLDIDFIIKIYDQYQLYDSFIYIYNCALKDFLFPFDSLLKILKQSIHPNRQFSKEDIIIGNKILVYLNCMLTCVYYPNKGKIVQEEQVEHLNNCYKKLTEKNNDNRLDVLDVLFQYDCIEYLNIILIAFDFLDKYHPKLLYWKQILIDQMILFIIEDENYFEDEQKNSFYIFLGRCSNDTDSIKIKNVHFEKMIDSLCKIKNKRFEERQQILIQIYKNDNLKSQIDEKKFLHNAQKNQMYKICELIYKNNCDWINLLSIYIMDQSKHEDIFNYIDFILAQNEDFFQNKVQNKNDFLNYVFENFPFLVQLDSFRSSQLFYSFIEHCDNLFELVVEKLNHVPEQLYKFLKQCIWKNRIQFENDNISSNTSCKLMIRDLCFDSKNQENFIKLACQFEPENIVSILNCLKEYNCNDILNICRNLGVRDGEAFILEKMKQYQDSFNIIFKSFQHSIDDVLEFVLKDNIEKNCDFEMISKEFHKLLSFCDRISNIEHQNIYQEKFWLFLLEYLIATKTNIKNLCREKFTKKCLDCISKLNTYLNLFFENLINEMLTHLNLIVFLEIIMDKIMKQNDDLICDIREMLLCILENYNYEKTLLELTTNILSNEQHKLIDNFRSLKTKSKNVKQFKCNLCSSSLSKNPGDKLITYNCHHLFHWECIEMIKKERSLNEIICPICHQHFQENCLKNNGGKNWKHFDDRNNHQKFKKLLFNETQLRILNHFHNGRLKKIIRR